MKKNNKTLVWGYILWMILLGISLCACQIKSTVETPDTAGNIISEETELVEDAVILYEEDFDSYGDICQKSGRNKDQNLYFSKRSDDAVAGIKADCLYLTGYSIDSIYILDSTDWVNYTVEADLCLKNDKGWGGLMFRMATEDSMAVASLSLNGTASLNVYTSSNLYAPGSQEVVCDAGIVVDTTYRLKVTVNENSVEMSYALYDSEGNLSDYTGLISAENTFPHLLLSGGVGVVAQGGCSLWMDNLIIKEGEKHEEKSAVADIYIPESGIVNPPVVVQSVTATSGLPATTAGPAVAIMDVDTDLNIVDGSTVIANLDEYFAVYRDTVIPAFVIDTQEEVDALITYLRSNDVIDAFVVADNENWELLQNFRKNYGEIRGILRYDSLETPEARREAVLLANTALANVVLSDAPLTMEGVTYFNSRAVSLWACETDAAGVYNAISAGYSGVVMENPVIAYSIYASITTVTNSGQPLPAAHRGHDNYSDNTARAIRKAVDEAGSRIAEIDLRLSRDNEIVLMHNADIDSTTNGTGYVSSYTVEELKQFDVIQLGEPTKIPTLEEVFQETLDDNIVFCCEIKENNEILVNRFNELVEQYNFQDRVIVFQGFGSIDNWNQETYTAGVGYVAGQANGLLSTSEPLKVVENFLMYLAPYNNQPIFVSYDTTEGISYKHSNEDMYYMLTARGFCNWKSTTNGEKNLIDALITQLGAVAALTDDPELTLDFAYFIEAEDIELAVGQAIPMEHPLVRIMYKELIACEITQVDGPKLVCDKEKGTYTLNEPGTVTLIYHTCVINSYGDYDVYSAPVTVTFK